MFNKKKEIKISDKPLKVDYVDGFAMLLNKNKFKTFAYHLGMESDHITDLIKENSYSFFHKTNIDIVINKIISDQLDVLIFLDIGMDPKIQVLSPLRLAPTQCCAYGVPVTTGLENID